MRYIISYYIILYRIIVLYFTLFYFITSSRGATTTGPHSGAPLPAGACSAAAILPPPQFSKFRTQKSFYFLPSLYNACEMHTWISLVAPRAIFRLVWILGLYLTHHRATNAHTEDYPTCLTQGALIDFC